MTDHFRAKIYMGVSQLVDTASSSFIQTVLSASEFHRIMPCGSWALPPVGNCTLPWRLLFNCIYSNTRFLPCQPFHDPKWFYLEHRDIAKVRLLNKLTMQRTDEAICFECELEKKAEPKSRAHSANAAFWERFARYIMHCQRQEICYNRIISDIL